VAAAAASADLVIVDVDAAVHNFDDPVVLMLDAGTYSVRPIGVESGGAYDAWNPWGETTCEVPEGCPQTNPTTVIGWKVSYDVISDAITAVSVSETPLEPAATDPPAGHYWIASETEPDRYHVDDDTVYPTPADALVAGESSTFTVSEAGPVGFAIRDAVVDDNTGGMSLAVVPVPEPSRPALLGAGIAALAVCARAPRPRRIGAGCRAAARRSAHR
jgi:hypothetical protein